MNYYQKEEFLSTQVHRDLGGCTDNNGAQDSTSFSNIRGAVKKKMRS